MSLKIVYGDEKYFASFHQTLDSVAQGSIESCEKIGIEKLELTVYPSNQPAKRLYKNCGFKESGIIKHYRKWNDQYFDVIQMELFF